MSEFPSKIALVQRLNEKIRHAGIKLFPPLTEAEVLGFERSKGMVLPSDYREFLLELGNGGSGPPTYGLCRLGELPKDFNSSFPDLSKPFPFTKPWVWEDGDSSPEGDEKDVRCGILILGTDGCGQYWSLVVNGPDRGRVWMLADVGIVPLDPRMKFQEWYEAWLDGKRDWWG